jgi:hypothetical protein
MIDLYPSKPASATAIVRFQSSSSVSLPFIANLCVQNNLVRCTMGGIGVGVIEKTIGAIDEAPAFLALAGLSAVSMILVWIAKTHGPRWRQDRLHRIKLQQEQESQQRCA